MIGPRGPALRDEMASGPQSPHSPHLRSLFIPDPYYKGGLNFFTWTLKRVVFQVIDMTKLMLKSQVINLKVHFTSYFIYFVVYFCIMLFDCFFDLNLFDGYLKH